ncbi:YsnF/AvaK domain-containing protein [Bacillus massilinigeriensis]|uniref:YsnF/AvaK domain-containing protein n=1 Tax=Bacillus mediterraneensis TaxID=1805474 RepID=UPI0008F847B1|nr:YsnF/AvaK domain-containing protein [Bacillus mediterraneensis]
MAKTVLGVYENQNDLIRAIENYQDKGYSVQDFSIIGETEDLSEALGMDNAIDKENIDGEGHKKEGFWKNLMSAFDGDVNLGGNGLSLEDRLTTIGLSEEDAQEYEEDVREGRIILLADRDVIGSGVSVDLDSNKGPLSKRNGLYGDRVDGTETEQTLKLREEEIEVSKDRVQAGELYVNKEVVEEQKTVNVPVTHEEVYVERRSVNDRDAGKIADDSETIRVPIMEEKVEVTKRPLVKEELVITKREVQDTEQVKENVRREEAKIEKEGEGKINRMEDSP